MTDTPHEAALVRGVLAGEPRAIARTISWIENGHPQAPALAGALYPHAGRAWTLGITGPPGAGKSTFVDQLLGAIRRTGKRVGVIAVDPASPFSGGAILGDRVRMADHQGDSGVYIRSMSSRGHLGGIALATEAAASVLDAAGYEVVIIETVGVGQSEIEVAELADATLLLQPPGLGDGVQAVKAGIMEVPAIFVVTKADLPGARQAASEIRQYLELVSAPADAWVPPVLLAASTGDRIAGIDAVWQAIASHRAHLEAHGGLAAQREARSAKLLWRAAERLLADRLHARSADLPARELLAALQTRTIAPHAASERLVEAFLAIASNS